MRIASLVPHATEALFALGLGDDVVAVTHECDHPPAARELPRLTRDLLAPGLSAAQIDAAVRERTRRGESIYELDSEALARLEPDLIVTQRLCPVCAVSYEEVCELAAGLPHAPRVISLDPHTLGEVLADIRMLAAATGREQAGEALVRDAAARVDSLAAALAGAGERPRVAALEWLDPVFVAGHWTPQLIELAGGDDVLGLPGEPSRRAHWDEVAAARPQVVIVMPCGFGAERSREEALAHASELGALDARVVAVDAASYFSRPGPRLIDGLELLAHVLHPQLAPAPPAGAGALTVAG